MDLREIYISLFVPVYFVFLFALYQFFRKSDSSPKIRLRDFFKNQKKEKRKLVDIVGRKPLIILGVIACVYVLYFVADAFIINVYRSDRIATTEEEIYDIINEGIWKGKGKIKFKSTFSTSGPDINRVIAGAETSGNYNGGEIWDMNFSTEFVSENEYNVTVKLDDPGPAYAWLVKVRAWRIASHYKDLRTDYDKVKAVHDYVAGVDSFRVGGGGAYNALFKGESSSVGYAYAFYAIMDQLGIPATVEANGNYVWNSVKVDGKWYNIDCMRDDPYAGGPTYGNFLKCDEDWLANTAWNKSAYGSSDAEESLGVSGMAAEEYCDMVPDYNLHRLLFELLLFLAPLAIFLVKINGKENHERDVKSNALMVINDWNYMAPGKVVSRYNAIVKKCYEPVKTETWYEENGKFYILKTEGEGNKITYITEEITRESFTEELNFLIMASEAKWSEDYHRMLIEVREALGLPIPDNKKLLR